MLHDLQWMYGSIWAPSFNYIYCFPGNIEIKRQTYKCPFDAFRLRSNKEFKTARQRHVPSQISLNSTRDEFAIATVHPEPFRDNSDAVQHLAMFNQLRLERSKVYNLTRTYTESYVVERSNPWLWTAILVWITSIVSSAAYYAFIYWSRTRGSKGSSRYKREPKGA